MFQRNAEYVKAAVNRKFAELDYAVIIQNNDIGKKLKKPDGVHLLDLGTSSRGTGISYQRLCPGCTENGEMNFDFQHQVVKYTFFTLLTPFLLSCLSIHFHTF